MRIIAFLTVFICLFSFSTIAQEKTGDNDNLRVFLDCTNTWCDNSYIKTEINYVDFVPDRFIANIYIMITSQRTGSGGQELVLYFSGQKNFNGMDDTLKFNRSSIATDDEYRKDLVQFIKLGLTRFVAKTSIANKLTISSIIKEGETPINSIANKKDPWNSWVMNINLNGNFNKDDYSKSYRYSTNISANKTTEKINTKNVFYYNKNIREIKKDGNITKYPNISYGAFSNTVASISDHWSVGGEVSYEHSTYSNLKSNIEVLGAIEYSLFPYKDAVKKAITVYYEVGPNWNKYIDTTYYNKLNDRLIAQLLSLNMEFVQKWGNISANIEWESFFNNFYLQGKKIRGTDVQNFSFGGEVEVRVFKGLSFYTYFGYDITKGVFPNISKEEFSEEDILSNVRQYPTSNRFYSSFGISYRFGSIYNNVVNPRFDRVF